MKPLLYSVLPRPPHPTRDGLAIRNYFLLAGLADEFRVRAAALLPPHLAGSGEYPPGIEVEEVPQAGRTLSRLAALAGSVLTREAYPALLYGSRPLSSLLAGWVAREKPAWVVAHSYHVAHGRDLLRRAGVGGLSQRGLADLESDGRERGVAARALARAVAGAARRAAGARHRRRGRRALLRLRGGCPDARRRSARSLPASSRTASTSPATGSGRSRPAKTGSSSWGTWRGRPTRKGSAGSARRCGRGSLSCGRSRAPRFSGARRRRISRAGRLRESRFPAKETTRGRTGTAPPWLSCLSLPAAAPGSRSWKPPPAACPSSRRRSAPRGSISSPAPRSSSRPGAQEFAGAVARLLADPAARRSLAAAARARVERQYDWRSIGRRFARELSGRAS